MPCRTVVLVMGLGLLALPATAQAQQQPPPVVWPDPPAAQREPPPPAARQPATPRQPARAKPAKPAQPAPEPETDDDRAARAATPARPKSSAAAAQNIRCDGPFAKDTSHAKLAQAFGAKNVVFQPVEGPGGGKLNATVVFPNDRKRRLEVLWHDETARAKPSSIVVESHSSWSVRGFRIGEPLANVEKANGKPFTLLGFEGETGGVARNWQGGALDKLSGGCLLGMRFGPDPSALQEARGKVAGDREFTSDNADIRAVRPTITELIVGYPQ
jgi:hypothetical protein